MGGNRPLVWCYGLALLGATVVVAAGLATVITVFPGRPELFALVALATMFALAIVIVLVGLAAYTLIKTGLSGFGR